MKIVRNISVPQKTDDLLTRWLTTSVLRRALPQVTCF